jgi:hypothetical protein
MMSKLKQSAASFSQSASARFMVKAKPSFLQKWENAAPERPQAPQMDQVCAFRALARSVVWVARCVVRHTQTRSLHATVSHAHGLLFIMDHLTQERLTNHLPLSLCHRLCLQTLPLVLLHIGRVERCSSEITEGKVEAHSNRGNIFTYLAFERDFAIQTRYLSTDSTVK